MSDNSARVAFASTGVANLASIMAAFRRAGAEPYLAADPADLAGAAFAVVPGVGSFGSAVSALRAAGMDEAIRDRLTRGVPTMGVCAGMQIFFESSTESPGVPGLALVGGAFGRFPPSLPVPQLGWNRVFAQSAKTAELRSARQEEELSASPGLVRQGWAYFANSYRLLEAPAGFEVSLAEYGEAFVAAAERPGLLLCQFHPELSGPWGLALIERWLGSAERGREGGER
jgi:imidazole glycerol phosphate synthase glutamine amidotransferase subunit